MLLAGEDLAHYERLSADRCRRAVRRHRGVLGPRCGRSPLGGAAPSPLESEPSPSFRGERSRATPYTRFGVDGVGPTFPMWHAREVRLVRQWTNFSTTVGSRSTHVTAETLSAKLDDVERIDRMIANAEARRHVVLREIDRHRAAVAARLRAAAEAIEEGEFEEVPGQARRQVRAAVTTHARSLPTEGTQDAAPAPVRRQVRAARRATRRSMGFLIRASGSDPRARGGEARCRDHRRKGRAFRARHSDR